MSRVAAGQSLTVNQLVDMEWKFGGKQRGRLGEREREREREREEGGGEREREREREREGERERERERGEREKLDD